MFEKQRINNRSELSLKMNQHEDSNIIYHKTGYFPQVQIFLNGKTLALTELRKSRSKQLKNSREQYFTQSLHVYTSVWTLVIYKMLVCKPAQYSRSVCISYVQRIQVWPVPLSLAGKAPASSYQLELLVCQQLQLQIEAFCCLLDVWDANQALNPHVRDII